MLEQNIRPHLQSVFFDRLAVLISNMGVKNPNVVTGISCFIGILFFPSLLMGFYYTAIALLWLSGLLDVVDGSVARLQGKDSMLGTVYDICADRLVEFFAIFALFLHDSDTRAIPIIGMLGAVLLCITSFLVVGLVSDKESNKSFYYSPGLMERAEAFIFFTLMVLLPKYFNILAWLFIALVLYTSMYRVYEYRKQCQM